MVKAMNRWIDINQCHNFSFEATQDDLCAIKNRFDFEHVLFVKGQFNISKDSSVTPCFILEGSVEVLVKNKEEDTPIKEDIQLYLVHHEDDLEKFDLTYDVEVLEDNKINIGEVIAQYLYLSAMNIDDEPNNDEPNDTNKKDIVF